MKPIVMKQQMITDFYMEYQARLQSFAIARLGNKEEAEDLVQDVFVKLMCYEGIVNAATIQSFVFTITNNEIKNILRRRICRHRVEDNIAYETVLQYCPVEHMAEFHDILHLVRYCMNKLSPSCAKVYRMTLFDDMSAGDISKNLGVSKRTVESQLFTSRKQMRRMMKAI